MNVKVNKFISIAFLLFALYLLAVRFILIFSYSVNLEGEEFAFVHFVQKLDIQKTLYLDPFSYPFTLCVYNPLYSYLILLLAKIATINVHEDTYALFVLARVVSFLFVFLQLYFMSKIFTFFTISKQLQIIAICLYLLLITGHFYVMRPDALITASFTIIVYSSLSYFFAKKESKYLYINFILTAIIVLLKQDAVIHLVILSLLIFLVKRDKNSFIVGCLTALIIILIYALLYSAYGSDFIKNTILFNFQITKNVKASYNFSVVIFSLQRLSLIVLASVVYWFRYNHSDKKNAIHLLFFAGLAELLVSHFFMLRPASNLNYVFVTVLYFLIITMIYLQTIFSLHFLVKVAAFLYILFLMTSDVILKYYVFSMSEIKHDKAIYSDMKKNKKELLSYLKGRSFFMPDPKNCIYFSKANMVYGYDFHIDRYLNLISTIQSETGTPLVNTAVYDSCFDNGKVQFILFEQSESNDYMQRYYPNFRLVDSINIYKIYEYTTDKNPN